MPKFYADIFQIDHNLWCCRLERWSPKMGLEELAEMEGYSREAAFYKARELLRDLRALNRRLNNRFYE